MSEVPISGVVGSPPALNNPNDVRIVQNLLTRVTPPLAVRVTVTGTVDVPTLHAIREFQARFMSHPDSRVDPDGRTIWHLNDGFVSRYIACTAAERRVIDRDIINAQKWVTQVTGRLSVPDTDAKRKLKNIFHIDPDNDAQASNLFQLLTRYRRLRQSLDEPFPLRCEHKGNLFAAWVERGDSTGTMHFPSGHFAQSPAQRTETIIHERSHTVFNIHHDGMSGAGELNLAQAPDDDNGFTHQQAMGNAYCYGWLATALQPDYVPPANDMIIVVPRPHR